MWYAKRRLLPAILASAIGGTLGLGGSRVFAAEPGQQDLQEQIKDLQSKVDQLQAKQQAMQAQQQAEKAEQQAKEQQQTAGSVLSDADKHSSALDLEGFTAGFKDNRFTLQSADGRFVLRPWIHIQIRNSTSWRQDALGHGDDDTENGFELRRARLGFDGNLFSPAFTYFINWATVRGNGSNNVNNSSGTKIGTVSNSLGGVPVLEEAWVKYNFQDTPWYVKAGQMHDPLDHEAIVGSKYRAPETSLTGDIFANTDTFTQGATAIYDPHRQFRFEGGITDGIRAANTNFQDAPNNGINYDWGLAARGEYKVMGRWRDYDQLTSYGDKEDLLVFGLGLDDSNGVHGLNSFSHTLDVQYATTTGWFFYGSYFGRYTRNNQGIPNGTFTSTSFGTFPHVGRDTYEFSLLGQAAYMIDGWIEPYGRYEYLKLAGTPGGSNNNVNEFSLGSNFYLHGHNAKFTAEMMYLPNGIPVNDDTHDVLISNNRAEITFIAQFQLLL